MPRSSTRRPSRSSQFLQAAVRVLRRLRRLRRDPVRQAGYPAVRRPHDRCQRHGLLLHLRRLRSDLPRTPPTTRATVPAWANSLFEDNAEFGFGMNLAITQRRDKLAETRHRAGRSAVEWRQPTSRRPCEAWLEKMNDARRLQGSRREAAGRLQGRHRSDRHRLRGKAATATLCKLTKRGSSPTPTC